MGGSVREGQARATRPSPLTVLPRVAQWAQRSTGRQSMRILSSSSPCSAWICRLLEKRSLRASVRPLSDVVMENSKVLRARVDAADTASWLPRRDSIVGGRWGGGGYKGLLCQRR